VQGAVIKVPRLHEALDHADVLIGVRPEHIRIVETGALKGRVFAVEYMGTRQLVTVDSDAGRLRVRAPNSIRLKDGETVGLDFDSERVVVFHPETERALASDLFAGAGHG
jgi:multiple sugar transport system ATP-binding protein